MRTVLCCLVNLCNLCPDRSEECIGPKKGLRFHLFVQHHEHADHFPPHDHHVFSTGLLY